MISAELRETLIIAVLQLLDAAHPSPQTVKQLLIPLKLSGLGELTELQLGSLMLDLEEKGWVKPKSSTAASEITRFTRTEEGRAFLRKNGF